MVLVGLLERLQLVELQEHQQLLVQVELVVPQQRLVQLVLLVLLHKMVQVEQVEPVDYLVIVIILHVQLLVEIV